MNILLYKCNNYYKLNSCTQILFIILEILAPYYGIQQGTSSFNIPTGKSFLL